MKLFYVLVDLNEKLIKTPIQKLPENWSNINGLNGYSDDELKDLVWAGHSSTGWIPYDSPILEEYSFEKEFIKMSKINITSEISNERKKREQNVLSFKNQRIKLDLESKFLLMFIRSNLNENNSNCISWAFLDDVIDLPKKDFLNLCDFAIFYLQNCLKVEINLKKEISNAVSLLDLQKINLDIEWPSTSYVEKLSFFDLIKKIIKDIKELISFIFGYNR